MYLTKSDYVLGINCPTKLSYKALKMYQVEDSDAMNEVFIEQGYQIQGLARSAYPDGILINTMNYQKSAELTQQYLQNENIVLFEAAFIMDGCFFRVDILEKRGSKLRMIEVKSKSEDPDDIKPYKRDGFLRKFYWEIFTDASFQYYNLQLIYGDNVTPYIMLIDKNAVATVDDLHLAFEKGETHLESIQKSEVLGDPLLFELNVKEYLDKMLEETRMNIEKLKGVIMSGEVVRSEIRQTCRSCEHRKTGGFEECVSTQLGWKEEDFKRNTIFDVWYMVKINALLEQKKYFFEDLVVEDFNNSKGELGKKGKRQWLQISQIRDNLGEYVDPELFKKMDSWEYPLQFIDFETAVPPLPSVKGLKPFETMAFQYSVHEYNEDGTLKHYDWISTRMKFPNFEFVRNLRKHLGDKGTVFCYSQHENSVLTSIKKELEKSEEQDRDELIDWITSITWKNNSPREMVDMFELVKLYYYHPKMGKSNSIKDVLPAVIHESEFLKKKYSEGYSSANYNDAKFLKDSENPYHLLKNEAGIAKGDEAMVAYLKIRQGDDSDADIVEHVLKRYCELDTLAMVMIFEHWNELKQTNI